MTCRHLAGDPACGSTAGGYQHAENQRYSEESAKAPLKKEIAALKQQLADLTTTTPDAANFEILDCEEVGTYVVLRVRYPICAKCSYEGVKVMVFGGCSLKNVLRWRRIDPHFRDSGVVQANEAPSPVARFPGGEDGWRDAVAWASSRRGGKVSDISALLDDYLRAENSLLATFDYEHSWHVLPVADLRKSFWRCSAGEVRWADSEDELLTGNGNCYSGEVYHDIVKRASTHTAVAVNTHCDGNIFLIIFDNSLERPE